MGLITRLNDRVDWIEPSVNLPIYCTCIASAQVQGGHISLVYCIDQNGPNGVERVAVLRQIIPLESLFDMRARVDEALEQRTRMLQG